MTRAYFRDTTQRQSSARARCDCGRRADRRLTSGLYSCARCAELDATPHGGAGERALEARIAKALERDPDLDTDAIAERFGITTGAAYTAICRSRFRKGA